MRRTSNPGYSERYDFITAALHGNFDFRNLLKPLDAGGVIDLNELIPGMKGKFKSR